jgi:hypothetical protein
MIGQIFDSDRVALVSEVGARAGQVFPVVVLQIWPPFRDSLRQYENTEKGVWGNVGRTVANRGKKSTQI